MISGNLKDGVLITDASNNVVAGNTIGLAFDLSLMAGAAQVNGVAIVSVSTSVTTTLNTIDPGNVINGNTNNGVLLTGANATNNTVDGNDIGIDPSNIAEPNQQNGVEIAAGANRNTIGGTTAAARNLISDNGNDGVLITGAGTTANVVEGNYIGTDSTGTNAAGNLANGVEIAGGANLNTIGGTTAAARNLISDNGNDGVLIYQINAVAPTVTEGNLIEGNYLGVNVNGNAVAPNQQNGVEITIDPNSTTLGDGNTVGGTAAGAANVISGNLKDGVLITDASNNVVAGNTIGLAFDFSLLGGAAQVNGVAIVSVSTTVTTMLNTIGAGNVIGGNTEDGVLLTGANATNNTVTGNDIGTDPTGATGLGNKASGVEIAASANNNTIGGTAAAAGNLIANNTLNGVLITTSGSLIAGNTIVLNGNDGVLITAAGTTANLLEGNFIGTDSTGTKVEGNKANGVEIATTANTNTVGGITAAAGNLIANNTLNGVLITTNGNLVAGNTILSNGTNGVEIAAGASANTIGATTAGAGNTIALNGNDGVLDHRRRHHGQPGRG